MNFHIEPVDSSNDEQIQLTIDQKTKPLGALGLLESVAFQMARIQQAEKIDVTPARHIVFAGDNGICDEGVNPFPQAVTTQMVLNFLQGGAAINCFCATQGISLNVVDAGVKADFEPHPLLLDKKIAKGTANFAVEPAMSSQQLNQALKSGMDVVDEVASESRVISFGEMGIGNTTTAAAIYAAILDLSAAECVGAGTGADESLINKKAAVIQPVLDSRDRWIAIDALQTFGGFEIAMMTGAYIRAAQLGKVIIVDGFISTAALLVAQAISPNLLQYCIFGHQSNEQAHIKALQHLKASPLLNLDMRLGEGTGAVAAYNLLKLAAAFYNDMASFADAGVSEK